MNVLIDLLYFKTDLNYLPGGSLQTVRNENDKDEKAKEEQK